MLAAPSRGQTDRFERLRDGIEARDVVRSGNREPDPSGIIDAKRVRIEAFAQGIDRPLFGVGIEATELIAQRERDPDRTVGSDLERVGSDTGVGVGLQR